MSGMKDSFKRRRRVDLEWRAVSTQPTSCEENVVKEVLVEGDDGSQIQEVRESSVSEAPASVDDDGEPIISVDKLSISIEVGSSLMRFIKGKGGSTQKNIEEELGVNILFPSSKKEDHIVIEGISNDSLSKAAERIQSIIDEAVQSRSLDYSHFISLPLAIHPELVDKLFDFQNCILGISNSGENEVPESESSEEDSAGEDDDLQVSDVAVKLKVEDNSEQVKVDMISIPVVSYPPKESEASKLSDLGIDKSIFIKPKTFHLTVLMLKLWNKERVSLASEVLQSISSKVIEALDNRPIHVRLKGLACMRGSLAKARVVYAPIEEIGGEGRLLHACQVIIDAYKEAGLVLERDAKEKLKLHATVMNARHRKRKKRTKKVDSFDARGIFKQYGSEHWGDYHLREAHLSQRFVFDENGYYHCCASIGLPDIAQLS